MTNTDMEQRKELVKCVVGMTGMLALPVPTESVCAAPGASIALGCTGPIHPVPNLPNWLSMTEYVEPFGGVELEYNIGGENEKS